MKKSLVIFSLVLLSVSFISAGVFGNLFSGKTNYVGDVVEITGDAVQQVGEVNIFQVTETECVGGGGEVKQRAGGKVCYGGVHDKKVLEGSAPASEDDWTEWFNRDEPGGSGDYETLNDFIKEGKEVCATPTDVQCRVKGTTSLITGDAVQQVGESDLIVGPGSVLTETTREACLAGGNTVTSCPHSENGCCRYADGSREILKAVQQVGEISSGGATLFLPTETECVGGGGTVQKRAACDVCRGGTYGGQCIKDTLKGTVVYSCYGTNTASCYGKSQMNCQYGCEWKNNLCVAKTCVSQTDKSTCESMYFPGCIWGLPPTAEENLNAVEESCVGVNTNSCEFSKLRCRLSSSCVLKTGSCVAKTCESQDAKLSCNLIGGCEWQLPVTLLDSIETPVPVVSDVPTTTSPIEEIVEVGQVISCRPDLGAVCRNKDNTEKCFDYEVRFLCPTEKVVEEGSCYGTNSLICSGKSQMNCVYGCGWINNACYSKACEDILDKNSCLNLASGCLWGIPEILPASQEKALYVEETPLDVADSQEPGVTVSQPPIEQGPSQTSSTPSAAPTTSPSSSTGNQTPTTSSESTTTQTPSSTESTTTTTTEAPTITSSTSENSKLALSYAYIVKGEGGSATINVGYSKAGGGCAAIYKEGSNGTELIFDYVAFLCADGRDIVRVYNDSLLYTPNNPNIPRVLNEVAIGDEIKICLSGETNICSKTVRVASDTIPEEVVEVKQVQELKDIQTSYCIGNSCKIFLTASRGKLNPIIDGVEHKFLFIGVKKDPDGTLSALLNLDSQGTNYLVVNQEQELSDYVVKINEINYDDKNLKEIYVLFTISPISCKGCLFGDTCYSVGAQVSSNYCSSSGTLEPLKNGGESCEINNECSNQMCIQNTCGSLTFSDWLADLFR